MPKSNHSITFIFYVLINVIALFFLQNFAHEMYLLFHNLGNDLFGFIFIISLSLFLYILIHELGHVMFGKLFSFKLQEFNVWFLCFKKSHYGSKLNLNFNSNRLFSLNGATIMNPSTIDHFTLKQFFLMVGGMLFNLVTILFSFYLLANNSIINSFMREFFIIFCYLSIVFILINAFPFYQGENLSDGRKIYNLFFSPSFKNSLILDSLDNNGLRPRDWLRFNIFLDLNNKKIADFDLTLKLNEFLSYVDCKNLDKSLSIIQDLLKYINFASIETNDLILIYIAYFYSTIQKDQKMVNVCLNKIRNKFKPDKFNFLFMKLLYAKGENLKTEFEEYKIHLLKYLERWDHKGTSLFLSESLNAIKIDD